MNNEERILSILTSIQEGQLRIEKRQESFEKRQEGFERTLIDIKKDISKLQKDVLVLKKAQKKIELDITFLKNSLNIMINSFDRENIALRKRVEAVEKHLGINPFL